MTGLNSANRQPKLEFYISVLVRVDVEHVLRSQRTVSSFKRPRTRTQPFFRDSFQIFSPSPPLCLGCSLPFGMFCLGFLAPFWDFRPCLSARSVFARSVFARSVFRCSKFAPGWSAAKETLKRNPAGRARSWVLEELRVKHQFQVAPRFGDLRCAPGWASGAGQCAERLLPEAHNKQRNRHSGNHSTCRSRRLARVPESKGLPGAAHQVREVHVRTIPAETRLQTQIAAIPTF